MCHPSTLVEKKSRGVAHIDIRLIISALIISFRLNDAIFVMYLCRLIYLFKRKR